jgi:hypothetical protein
MRVKDKDVPALITEEDGPFTYTYMALLAVPGIRLEDSQQALKLFSFADLNADVILTSEWDKYCLHMDRGAAIGTLILTGLRGGYRFKKISIYWNKLRRKILGADKTFYHNLEREEKVTKESRHREYKTSGCYLIYSANGDLLEQPRLDAARKIGVIGYGLDMINGENYRSVHRSALHSAATALSLTISDGNGSPEINFLRDSIHLNGVRGLIIYPRKIEMGAVGVVTSTGPKADDLKKIRGKGVGLNLPQFFVTNCAFAF